MPGAAVPVRPLIRPQGVAYAVAWAHPTAQYLYQEESAFLPMSAREDYAKPTDRSIPSFPRPFSASRCSGFHLQESGATIATVVARPHGRSRACTIYRLSFENSTYRRRSSIKRRFELLRCPHSPRQCRIICSTRF